MKYHKLGNTGFEVSAIGYGGVVSSQHFDDAAIPGDGQKMSDDRLPAVREFPFYDPDCYDETL